MVLILLLGVGLIVLDWARRPQTWRWLDALVQGGNKAGDVAAESSVDTRLEMPSPEKEILGAFISPPAMPSAPATAPAASKYFDGVNPDYLATVQDNAPWRPREMHACFHLLEILKKTPEATLQRAAVGHITFAQLYSQSDEYRGKLVTLRGTVRRAFRQAAPKNEYGIEHYDQLWLQPADNRSCPIVIYCVRLPEGFPVGTAVEADVDVTGFYLKRCAYQAQDTLRTAPAVFAKTVQWHKQPALPTPPSVEKEWTPLLLIAAAGLLSVLTVAYVYLRTRRPPKTRPESPPVFDNLSDDKS